MLKKRLDHLIVERGLAESRTKAQALIMAGAVRVNGHEHPKAGTLLDPAVSISMESAPRWVGRGGEKLDGAIERFGIEIAGVWLDCGASTGGFTDVLLSRGAEKIYAIDVGYGQLDQRLRADSRVVVIDRFNIRNLTRAKVGDDLDGATLDLSFISSRLVLPVIAPFLKAGADIVLLLKPQFEGTPADLKKGIVRDDETRARITSDFETWCGENRWAIHGKMTSPITGRKGNVEFLYHLRRA